MYSELDYGHEGSDDFECPLEQQMEFTPTSTPQSQPTYSGHLYGNPIVSPDHTPSRLRGSTHWKQQPYPPHPPHPYNREVPFQISSRPLSTPYRGPSVCNQELSSVLESQKVMMKAQENLMEMVKKVSERVEDIEKSQSQLSTPSPDDEKKLPPVLSVSCCAKCIK